MLGVRDRLLMPVALLKVAATRPTELIDRIEGRRENERQKTQGSGGTDLVGKVVPPVDAVHELLNVTTCEICDDLPGVLEKVLGRSYDPHRFDGGTALSQMLWVAVRHLQPERVVETGVARGVSSALILDALSRNGSGYLWSIDLPPIRYTSQIMPGAAVPDHLSDRWTYIRGSSRRHLPVLLEELGGVDLFVHDGLHTPETMTFEFHHVWPYLSDGGVLVADDVHLNGAFTSFAERVGEDPLLVAELDKETIVGLLTR